MEKLRAKMAELASHSASDATAKPSAAVPDTRSGGTREATTGGRAADSGVGTARVAELEAALAAEKNAAQNASNYMQARIDQLAAQLSLSGGEEQEGEGDKSILRHVHSENERLQVRASRRHPARKPLGLRCVTARPWRARRVGRRLMGAPYARKGKKLVGGGGWRGGGGRHKLPHHCVFSLLALSRPHFGVPSPSPSLSLARQAEVKRVNDMLGAVKRELELVRRPAGDKFEDVMIDELRNMRETFEAKLVAASEVAKDRQAAHRKEIRSVFCSATNAPCRVSRARLRRYPRTARSLAHASPCVRPRRSDAQGAAGGPRQGARCDGVADLIPDGKAALLG
jgi:hypothetical protein